MKNNESREVRVRRVCRFIFLVMFITFFTIYISGMCGYFEYEQYKKKTFTSEQIKQFESDIKEGKNVDIESYLDNTDRNYQNNVSNFFLSVSDNISKYMRKGINAVLGGISNAIE